MSEEGRAPGRDAQDRPQRLAADPTPRGEVALDSAAVLVDALDVRLPCRTFRVRYKVAEAGQHTLTSEFLLRLLRVAGDLAEDVIAAFFGFDPAEVGFVIGEAEKRALVFRSGGRVHLTAAGIAAFEKGGGKPQLYEIHQVHGSVAFDTVTFAPAQAMRLEGFAKELLELPVLDESKLARASEAASAAFRRHFRDLQPGWRDAGARRELYTIDEIVPERRRDELVPFGLQVSAGAPGDPRPDLADWRSQDLDSREGVLTSCAALLAGLKVDGPAAEEAFALLAELVPETAARFRRKDTFDRRAFFKHAAGRVGDLQANRRTVAIVGTLWTPRNVERLSTARQVLARDDAPDGPSVLFWLRPPLPHWGSNCILPKFLGQFVKLMAPDSDDDATTAYARVGAGLTAPAPLRQRDRHLFDGFLTLAPKTAPPGLELFLFPQRLAAVLVHAPIGAEPGHPVAVGILSVEPQVLERVHGMVSDLLARNVQGQSWSNEDRAPLERLRDAIELPAIPSARAPEGA